MKSAGLLFELVGGFCVGWSIGWPTSSFNPVLCLIGIAVWGTGMHLVNRKKS